MRQSLRQKHFPFRNQGFSVVWSARQVSVPFLDLALEVLAVLWNAKEEWLRGYIEYDIATGEPARIARALMVAGLSTQSLFGDEILARYKHAAGFIGTARNAAMYAYDRNVWAEHWFKRMHEAARPEDFWRYAVLFMKIVDGRFEVWKTADLGRGEPFRLFWPIESNLESRFKKWQQHREKKLFGDNAPLPIFLH